MKKEILYLGLDVHAENIAVALAEPGRDGELRNHGQIPNTFHSVEKLMRKLGHPDKELRVCYEAGPCGFVLARFLKKKGIACIVIAPSLTPKGPAAKIKTDRRDARMLARLHRAGELSAVQDLRSGRHQLKAFLLRNGYHYGSSLHWWSPDGVRPGANDSGMNASRLSRSCFLTGFSVTSSVLALPSRVRVFAPVNPGREAWPRTASS